MSPGNLWSVILPAGYDSASPSSHTRWRDLSVDQQEEVTWPLIARGAQGIADRLLHDVGMVAARWKDLIQVFRNLAPEHRDEALRLLTKAEPGINDDDDRAVISGALRDLLNHHRTVPDADWALPAVALDAVDLVYHALEPRDPIRKFSWLFSPTVRLPRPIAEMRGEAASTAAWKANDAEAANQRRAAVEELLVTGGVKAVFGMAAAAEAPGLVGAAVADLPQHSAERDAILCVH